MFTLRWKLHLRYEKWVLREDGNGSMFLAATVLVLTATLLLQPIVLVNAQPNPGDYIVTEFFADALSKVTPGGVRTVIYTFAGGTNPAGVAIDSGGNYIVAENGAAFMLLSKVTPSGVRTVILGGLGFPTGVAIDSTGNYIVTETLVGAQVLSKITPGGVRTVIFTFAAGTAPAGVAIDSAGNYIVAEFVTGVLSKVTPGGVRTVIYTFAGGTGPYGVAIVPTPTPTPRPVGGVLTPVNKLDLLAPYLALICLIGTVTTVFAMRRRRKS